MYEMYPETWAAATAPRDTPEPPRRRPRRAHCVLPAVIARQLEATGPRHVLG